MASTIVGTMNVTPVFTETLANGLTVALKNAFATIAVTYGPGTGANQADVIALRPLRLTAPLPLDWTSFLDSDGTVKNMARLREFLLVIQDTDPTHTALVYQGAANGWAFLPPQANALTAFPGGNGCVHLSDPASTGAGVGMVTAGGSKSVVIDPGSNVPLVGHLLVVGCTATS